MQDKKHFASKRKKIPKQKIYGEKGKTALTQVKLNFSMKKWRKIHIKDQETFI